MSKNTLENRFFINKRLKIKQTTGKIEAISRFTRRVSLLSGLGELFSVRKLVSRPARSKSYDCVPSIVERILLLCFSLLARLIHDGGTRLNHDPQDVEGGEGGSGEGSFLSPYSSPTISFHCFFVLLPY